MQSSVESGESNFEACDGSSVLPASSSDNEDFFSVSNPNGGYSVLALYKFFILPEPTSHAKARLEEFLRPRHARGLLLLAADEGINGTISYPTIHDEDIQIFLKTKICWEMALTERPENNTNDASSTGKNNGSHQDQLLYRRLRLCVSHNNNAHVFHRLKIKERNEIVSMMGGVPLRQVIPSFLCAEKEVVLFPLETEEAFSANATTSSTNVPSLSNKQTEKPQEQQERFESDSPSQDILAVGTYVKPGAEWHALLHDPNCWVIDMRNDYEIALGTFPNATNPVTTSFTEFPSWFQKQIQQQRPPNQAFDKVAMFCTGGIRCEKASAYCLQQLQQQNQIIANIPVFHLEGGILSYLKQVPEDQSLWQGDCYVFDQRTAVTHGLRPSPRYSTCCHACRHPLSPEDTGSPEYRPGIACPYCAGDPDKERRRQRYWERQSQIQLSETRQTRHIHDPKEILPAVQGLE
ncbi:hypothetical protein ACA910_003002 [Epithemia clementina (nom. ined.)]